MFLVKHKICKCWLHYGAASIETFLKGASNKKSLGTAGLDDSTKTINVITCNYGYPSYILKYPTFLSIQYFSLPISNICVLFSGVRLV